MNTEYRDIFRKIPGIKAPRGLSDTVMDRVETYTIRRLRMRAIGHGILLVTVLALSVPAIRYVSTSVAQSGFGTYMSLIFSDSGYVTSHWSEFVTLLADSLPVTGTIAVLALLAVFANSLRRISISIGSISAHNRRPA